MLWNEKLWDLFDNVYWTPRYVGLKSISQKHWMIDDDRISIPKDLVNLTGPLYTRRTKASVIRDELSRQEEILNHFFNIAFAILSDHIISRLLFRPLAISDNGPFVSLGREVAARYGWPNGENVTQQDGLFLSTESLIGVELKLGSTSWPEQIAKYLALMVLEENVSGCKEHLGLLFIVPESAVQNHWRTVGLESSMVGGWYLKKFDESKLPKRIRNLFDEYPEKIRSVLERLKLSVVSWTAFRDEIKRIESEECPGPCGQTLARLLAGLRAQIEAHQGTGIG
jgi:hypothetical protein